MSNLIHFLALSALTLYLILVVRLVLKLATKGVNLTVLNWEAQLHGLARVLLLLLIFCSLLFDSGRGGPLLWLGGCLEILALTVVRLHGLVRLGVTTGVVLLLSFSSVLVHLPSGLAQRGSLPAGGESSLSSLMFLIIHIAPAIIAQAMLILSGLCGVIFIIQSSFLKKRNIHIISSKLPSLTMLQKWGDMFALFGFLLMSFGILVGFCGSLISGVILVAWDWGLAIAVVAWFQLGTLVFARHIAMISARNGAWLAVLSIPILLLFCLWAFLGNGTSHYRSISTGIEVSQ
jgi:ABC-type uncharacterized transport system permease subunit